MVWSRPCPLPWRPAHLPYSWTRHGDKDAHRKRSTAAEERAAAAQRSRPPEAAAGNSIGPFRTLIVCRRRGQRGPRAARQRPRPAPSGSSRATGSAVSELAALARQVLCRDRRDPRGRVRSARAARFGEPDHHLRGPGGAAFRHRRRRPRARLLVLAEDQLTEQAPGRRGCAGLRSQRRSARLKTPGGRALALLAQETIEDAADDAEAVRRFMPGGCGRRPSQADVPRSGPHHAVQDPGGRAGARPGAEFPSIRRRRRGARPVAG